MKTNKGLGAAWLASGAVAMSLLLGVSAAQAATVLASGTQAYRIENLEVESGGSVIGLFNVDFLWTSAEAIYGSPTPVFDFPSQTTVEAARDAVNAALNAYNAQLVNPPPDVVTTGPQDLSVTPNFFKIGFAWDSQDPAIIETVDGIYDNPSELWISNGVDDTVSLNGTTLYADFSPVPVPAAVWLFGSGVLALGAVARRRKQTA